MNKKVFITGVSGFVGSHLADYLLTENKYDISGTYLTDGSLRNLDHTNNQVNLFQLDLQDSSKTQNILSTVKPDLIFHLAALPAVGKSLENPRETLVNNITAELSLLEAIKNLNFKHTRVLIVTSADVYGKVSEKDIPIDETTPFMPTNAYAVSKIAQDFLALQYFVSYALNIVRVRPFNHFGPRQSPGFVVADFAKKIAHIEKRQMEPVLHVGNVTTRRDFTDVRDIVRAYVLLIEKGIAGEVYNIGQGKSYKISEILDILITNSTKEITIEKDKSLFRPEDAPERICDNTKFKSLTGWEPKIPLQQALKDTLDYWRNIV